MRNRAEIPTKGPAPNTRLARLIMLCGFVLIAGMIGFTCIMLLNFRDREIDRSEHELERLALVLTEQLDRTFQSIELVQTAVIDGMQALDIASAEELNRRMSGYDTHQHLKTLISALPHIDAIILTDSRGNLINFSRSWPIPRVKPPAHDPSEAFRADPRQTVVVGEPIRGPATGEWMVPVSRRLSGPNGEFLGVLSGVIKLQYFERLFESICGTQDCSIALFRRNGTLLVRYPRRDSAIGESFAFSNTFTTVLSHTNRATVRRISLIDGKERLVSSRGMAHYPIIVTITTTTDAALANWRTTTVSVTGIAVIAILAIGGAIALIAHRVGTSFREQSLRLSTALNNMSHGLVMFDAAMRLIVWNDRYLQMYGLSDKVVRRKLMVGDLIKHITGSGLVVGDPEEYTSELLDSLRQGGTVETFRQMTDGRTVRITNQPMPGGGWVATHEDITERLRANQQIAYLAHHDPLTGLANRTLFAQHLEQELARVKRGGGLALMYIDLDNFKRVNDTLGHLLGDALLKSAAGRLQGCLRETDFVARLGGDEFAIIQTSVESTSDAVALATRIQSAMKAPFVLNGHQAVVAASIGISIAPQDASERDQLQKNADMALYGAKDGGRGNYRFYEPVMDEQARIRHKLEGDLRDALGKGQFDVHYQPIVDLQTDQIRCCEALLRWQHPDRGAISPAEFIPIAEESELIIQLGEWVLRRACADAANWPKEIKVAVNLSPIQLTDGKLPQVVIGALAASGISASRLELEITEAVLIRDTEAALAALHRLRELGVRISMDDFGIGYSSLSYLQSFPFDTIKIDRSFIASIGEKDSSIAIVQAVTGMAQRLNMRTIAEGVETQDQREIVRGLGCDEMQGYLFSGPRPAQETVRLFSDYGIPSQRTASAA